MAYNIIREYFRNIFPPQESSALCHDIARMLRDTAERVCDHRDIGKFALVERMERRLYNSGGPAHSLSRESLRMLALQVIEVPESALQISPAAVYSLSTVDTNREL